jgi:hypothetical protein
MCRASRRSQFTSASASRFRRSSPMSPSCGCTPATAGVVPRGWGLSRPSWNSTRRSAPPCGPLLSIISALYAGDTVLRVGVPARSALACPAALLSSRGEQPHSFRHDKFIYDKLCTDTGREVLYRRCHESVIKPQRCPCLWISRLPPLIAKRRTFEESLRDAKVCSARHAARTQQNGRRDLPPGRGT